MELNGLSERARKLIESCGYGKPHFMSEDDVAERQAFFEEELSLIHISEPTRPY